MGDGRAVVGGRRPVQRDGGGRGTQQRRRVGLVGHRGPRLERRLIAPLRLPDLVPGLGESPSQGKWVDRGTPAVGWTLAQHWCACDAHDGQSLRFALTSARFKLQWVSSGPWAAAASGPCRPGAAEQERQAAHVQAAPVRWLSLPNISSWGQQYQCRCCRFCWQRAILTSIQDSAVQRCVVSHLYARTVARCWYKLDHSAAHFRPLVHFRKALQHQSAGKFSTTYRVCLRVLP